MLKVTLLSHTPEPEKLVASAAKLCYSNASIEEIGANLTPEKIEKFLNMLTDLGHESPIEHISFTFGIEGVSRTLLAQITRHRLASFSVKSQRYVKEGRFSFVIPPEIEKNEEAKALFLKTMEADQKAYDHLTDILFEKHLKELTAQGIPEKTAKSKAEKMAIEDARFVLPNACDTSMVVTMNARSLLNFFRLRCCSRAQWEIRELATKMLELVKKTAPTIFRYAGPGCVNAPCPEGKMSCGKKQEMMDYFRNL